MLSKSIVEVHDHTCGFGSDEAAVMAEVLGGVADN